MRNAPGACLAVAFAALFGGPSHAKKPAARPAAATATPPNVDYYTPILKIAPGAGGRVEITVGRGADHGVAVGMAGDLFTRSEEGGSGKWLGKVDVVAAFARTAVGVPRSYISVENIVVGAWIVFQIPPPRDVYKGALWELARLGIVFLDNQREPLVPVDELLLARDDAAEKRALAAMVVAGTEVIEFTQDIPFKPTHGRWKGTLLKDALAVATADDFRVFLRFVLDFPGKYIGHEWKVSEVFATWFMNDAPNSLGDEFDEMLTVGDVGHALAVGDVAALRAALRNVSFSPSLVGAGLLGHPEVTSLVSLLARLRDGAPKGSVVAARLEEVRAGVLAHYRRKDVGTVEAYRRAAELYVAAGDTVAAGGARFQAADLYVELGDGANALKEYRAVMDVAHAAAVAGDDQAALALELEHLSLFRIGATLLLEHGDYARVVADFTVFVEKHATGAATSKLPDAMTREAESEFVEALAMAERKLGHLDAAAKLYERRRKAKLGPLATARLTYQVGDLYYGSSQWEKAAAEYKRSAVEARAAGSPGDEAKALGASAQALWNLGKLKDALALHDEGMKVRRATGDRSGIAWQRLQVAKIRVQMGDREAAEKDYEEVLQIRHDLGEKAGEAEMHAELGELDCELLRVDRCESEYAEAVKLYQALARLPDVASSLLGVGRARAAKHDYRGGADAIRQSIAIDEKTGDQSGMASALEWLGRILAYEGDRAGSDAAFVRVLAVAKDDPGMRVLALAGQGGNAVADGKLDVAEQLATDALALAESMKEPARVLVAIMLRADVRQQRGEYELGLADYDRAYALADQTGNRVAKNNSLQQRAWALVHIGRLAEAKVAAEKAMPIAEQNNDPVEKAWALNTIGEVLQPLGDLAGAMKAYDASVELMHKGEYRYGEAAMIFNRSLLRIELRDLDGAIADNARAAAIARGTSTAELDIALVASRARILALQGKYDDAEKASREALGRARTATPDRVTGLLEDLADAQARSGDTKAALVTLAEAVALDEKRPGKQYGALAMLGKTQALAGDDAAAHKSLGEAVARATARGGAVPWEPLYYLGLVEARTGDQDGAVATLERAVREAERAEVLLGDDRARARYRSDKLEAYQLLIKLLLEKGRVEDGLKYLERAKSSELADFGRKTAAKDDPAQALAVELDVQEANIEKLADGERAKAAPDDDKVKRLDAAIEDIRRRRASFLDKLDRTSDLFDRYAMKPLELEKLQQHLPDGMLVVSPVVLGDKLVVFAVTSTLITHFEADVKPGEVGELVEKMRAELLPDKLRRGAATKGAAQHSPASSPNAESLERLKPIARRLYDILLRQPLTQLGTPKIIAVSASGALRYLPFAALLDGEQWVIEKAPVLALTTLDREKFDGTPPPVAGAVHKDPTVLALADPDGSLPGALGEVAAVQKILTATVVFSGKAATKGQLRAQARRPGFDIVHLATHGRLDADNPERSNILLADDSLYYPDIPALPLDHTRLVVLSACETAMQAKGSGVEIAGLAYQFERTHVKSVLATLWPVDDAATAALMTDFYGELRDGGTVAEALAGAQRKLLRADDKTWKHPAFWAPFILMGAP